MKSLEEVIKYKLNFLPKGIDPFYDIQTYKEESCEKYYREKGLGKFHDIHIKTINENFYEVNLCSSHLDDIELHRISPIKSREYNHFSRIGFYYRYINPLMILFEGTFCYNLTEEEERLFYEREAEEIRLEHEREAEEIRLFYERGVEEGRISQPDSDDNNDEEKEELSINDFKTFKLEECVICLEKEPKVLFCNCGHLCICEKSRSQVR